MNTQQYIDLIADVTANSGASIVSGIFMTLFLFTITLVLGALLGIRLFMWYYNGNKIVTSIINVIYAYMNYVPMSTFLIFVFYIFFRGNGKLNVVAAIIALSVIFAFSVFYSLEISIKSVSQGEIEAAYSMGYDRKLTLKKIILPAALPMFLFQLRANVIKHVQNTAIVEIISVMDIQMVADIIASEGIVPIIPIAITTVVYILIGFGGARLIDHISEKLNRERTAEEQKERFAQGKF